MNQNIAARACACTALFLFLFGSVTSAQQAAPPASVPVRPAAGAGNPMQPSTTPPEHVDRGLRPLTPEEIPPNLNFYTLDPFYEPGRALGWSATRIEEKLDRGMIAMALDDGTTYVGWRLLESDPPDTTFDLYRVSGGGAPVKLNAAPLARTTDFVDPDAPRARENAWFVRAVVNGREVPGSEAAPAALPANARAQAYRSFKLRDDVQGVAIVAVGDLDGDGTYDFVVKHGAGMGKDPGRVRPNTGTYKIDAYHGRTGAFLWRMDLGWNVDMGIWWTPMVVRDLDGDNCAEVCLRTAPYAASLEEAFPSARTGNVLEGPEWLSVLDGRTGREIDKVDWIERGRVQDWADNTGNRASRHMLGIAYLDGKTPSVLVVRGTYGLMKVDAWMLKDRKLEKVWRWSNERAPFKYQGQGQHSIKVGDIDGDGCDEVLNGTIAIDHDGRTLWCNGNGHGDRFYLADVDPSNPGLEVFYIHEDPHPRNGLGLYDARTGNLLWGLDEPTKDNQLGGAMVADIDPTLPGMECWASAGENLLFDAKGHRLGEAQPPGGYALWWDADLLRELVAGGPRGQGSGGGSSIRKWKGSTLAQGLSGPVHQIADLLGDWREEIVTVYEGELRIYSSPIPAADRRVCLMQDPVYRHDVTHRSMGYPHAPQLSHPLETRE